MNLRVRFLEHVAPQCTLLQVKTPALDVKKTEGQEIMVYYHQCCNNPVNFASYTNKTWRIR